MINRLALLLLLMPVCCFAQYKGGQDDGAVGKLQVKQNALPTVYTGGAGNIYAYAMVTGQNPTPGIYNGGRDDGIAMVNPHAKQNVLPGIYAGGKDDGSGAIVVTFQNAFDNIYAGGDNDGADSRIDSAQNKLPSIYTGGHDDGADVRKVTLNNPLPGIYTGGKDDGFATLKRTVQNAMPLRPAGVVEFSGKWAAGDAQLQWAVSNMPGIARYELERSGDGGKTFTRISVVQAAKNGTNYTNTDKGAYGLPADILMYRLTCVREDGSAAYAGLARLTKDAAAPVLVVYPNPTAGRFTLAMDNMRDGYRGYEYVISTTDGKVLFKGNIKNAHTSFNLSDKAAGAYFLTVFKNGKTVQNYTIIVAH